MDNEPRHLESRKLLHDYLKHLATLSTGAILLVVSFVDEVFATPEWNGLVGVSIVSFAVCVVASVIAQAGNIDAAEAGEGASRGPSATAGLGLMAAWLTYSVGIISLLIFALKNLY